MLRQFIDPRVSRRELGRNYLRKPSFQALPATCPGHGQRVCQRGGRGVRRPGPRRVERVGVAGEAEGRVQPAPRVHHRRAEGQGAVVVGGQLHAGLGEVLLRNTDEPFNTNTLDT